MPDDAIIIPVKTTRRGAEILRAVMDIYALDGPATESCGAWDPDGVTPNGPYDPDEVRRVGVQVVRAVDAAIGAVPSEADRVEAQLQGAGR